jgi:hypothetical protein
LPVKESQQNRHQGKGGQACYGEISQQSEHGSPEHLH